MRHTARIAIGLLIAVAGCGGSSTSPSTGGNNNPPPQQGGQGSTSNSITVGNNFFEPSSTTVPVGTQVTWTWNACNNDGYGGQTCVSHGIVFDDGPTAAAQTQGSWSRTFTAAGTYKYHCTVHGASMAGTIVIK